MAKDKNKAHFESLRSNAEQMLANLHPARALKPADNIDAVLQELQVHQIELELQNEELQVANQETELQRLKFESIYDLAPVGYLIINYSGIIEEVNSTCMTLLEAGKAAIRGKSLQSFIHPDDAESYYRFFKELLKQNTLQRFQFQFVTKNGRMFYGLLEGRTVPVTGKCYITLIDITEGIESRIELAQTKDRLQLALEASAAGTWELHYPSMAFYLDNIGQRICCEAGKFELNYKSFTELVYVDDRFAVDQHFRTAINTQSEIDIVGRFLNKAGGLCYASIRGHLVDTAPDKEKRFTGIITDITEKVKAEEKQAEEKRSRRKEISVAAMQAEEKERKRISEALHDSVSQLLYGIKIQLSQLTESTLTVERARLNELIDLAIKETRNISFELAPAILTDFGLPATISEICERLSTPNIGLTATVLGFDRRADVLLETLIFRIVQELVNNCMKHAAASRINIQIKKSKNIIIAVKDNGTGIFLPHRETRPNGAGLASIKNRIALYNGVMAIEATAGKGTTVKITLENNERK